MSEQQSPWSRSGSVDTEPAAAAYPQTPKQPVGPLIDVGPGWSRSGTVTGLGGAAPHPVGAGGGLAARSPRDPELALVLACGAGVVALCLGGRLGVGASRGEAVPGANH